ncbi:MAG: Phosphoribosylglycinamide formyltransferase [Planctomycetes bacterium]|nr:Phosphoribosylglycinamide formyltransferase [Planctomycetota bacterium]MCQ3949468.1 phosphoribosylglycinamide formyltransferase [Planctomycetota bacterium]GIK51094.1 MAG: phosphoribosylglycinamide formyltransferase [Planctomycetota bacterium]HRJ77047.1 phosphoribosylglycinamide formyltransferase [Planctomycetota bacterium]
MTPKAKPVSAVILISGSGTTMQNLVERSRDGRCNLDVLGVISSKHGVPGIDRAKGLNVPVAVCARADYTDADAFSHALFKMIAFKKPDLVLLAGFLSYISLPQRYAGRCMNVHPSLLPKFGGKGMYGIKVHEKVLKHHEKESGCTVHFVDQQYDHGPIILQKKVPVLPEDTALTLSERVQAAEREAYPEAINLYAEHRLLLQGHAVKILPQTPTSGRFARTGP